MIPNNMMKNTYSITGYTQIELNKTNKKAQIMLIHIQLILNLSHIDNKDI